MVYNHHSFDYCPSGLEKYILSFFYRSLRVLSLISPAGFYHCPQGREKLLIHQVEFFQKSSPAKRREVETILTLSDRLNILYWNCLNCWIGKINHQCLPFCKMNVLQKIISISHCIYILQKFPLLS